jgi:autotransporter-associated beta strand protein
MRKKCGAALAATSVTFALAFGRAHAATHIDVGTNDLLPNTANQVITLLVTNDAGTTTPQVTDFAGYFQIGPNTLDQVVPVFQGADFTNTFWGAGSAGGVGPEPGLPQLMQKGFSLDAGTATANGNLINLIVDTTGIPSGTFALKLTNNAYTDVFGQNSLFLPSAANDALTINNGSITIVVGSTNYYWDMNGTAAGAGGAAPAGNWDGTTANFNSDAAGGAGGSLSAAPAAADNVTFAAGSDATGTYTITVSGTRSAAAVKVEEGNVTLTGGTLAVGAFNVAPGASANVSSTITGGVSGSLVKTGAGTLTLAAANSHAGGTTVAGGTLVLANADATAGAAITVADGALAQAQAGLAKAVTVSTLATNTSGKLDITDNSMVMKGMTAAQAQALLAAGYNAGQWDGPAGITSSTAAASTETSVGFASNASLNLTTFKGVSGLTTSDVLVKYTYAGDANLDGKVDIGDLGLLAGAWQQSGKVWFDGDFSYDGAVNIGDLGLLAGNWQKGVSSGQLLVSFDQAMAQFAAFDGVVVPEPASLSLLALGGGLALGRRQPRRQ